MKLCNTPYISNSEIGCDISCDGDDKKYVTESYESNIQILYDTTLNMSTEVFYDTVKKVILRHWLTQPSHRQLKRL